MSQNKPQLAEELLSDKSPNYRNSRKSGTGQAAVSANHCLEAIKEAQRQAVQYALQVAAKNAKIDNIRYVLGEGTRQISNVFATKDGNTYQVYNESILSLEQQILKDLGI